MDDEEEWKCDRCGDEDQEKLAYYETGRITRLTPHGDKVVCLCIDCRNKVKCGPVVTS